MPTSLVLVMMMLSQPAGSGGPPALKPVEPGISDVSTLGQALRLEPLQLRQESDFSRVYELEPEGLFARRRFARKAGAITAIFPQSSYVLTPGGQVPAIPNDTVFYLGDAPETPSKGGGVTSRLAADLRVMPVASTSVGAQSVPASPAARAEARPGPARVSEASSRTTSIWTDRAYREHRLDELMDEALRRGDE